jgi:hypothetical protein
MTTWHAILLLNSGLTGVFKIDLDARKALSEPRATSAGSGRRWLVGKNQRSVTGTSPSINTKQFTRSSHRLPPRPPLSAKTEALPCAAHARPEIGVLSGVTHIDKRHALVAGKNKKNSFQERFRFGSLDNTHTHGACFPPTPIDRPTTAVLTLLLSEISLHRSQHSDRCRYGRSLVDYMVV